MKKKYSIYFLLLISFMTLAGKQLSAQGIYQLWGTTGSGGIHNKGALFSTKYDGTGFDVKKTFTISYPGGADFYNKPVLYNNKFYCAMSEGGLNSNGIIASFDPVTLVWEKKADMFTIDGKNPQGSLLLYNNKLYGVCLGGANNRGILFEFNPANNVLTNRHDFEELTGSHPRSGLTLYNNKFYGVTIDDYLNDAGALFEFNPATNIYTKKVSFNNATIGNIEYGTELLVYNNLLWGITSSGALNDKGAIFSFNPANNALLKKADFETIASSVTSNSLTLLNNKFYGTTNNGGTYNQGVIFEFNPANNALNIEYNIGYATAKHKMNFTVYNNILYSCSSIGGANTFGQLFSFNPATNQYTALLDMNESIGSRGSGAVTLYNNKLYGFTIQGGAHNRGNLFSYNLQNASFQTLINLGGDELCHPSGQVVYYNNKIYGTCITGGTMQNASNTGGGIYEYDPATNIYTIKANFVDSIARQYINGGFTLLNNKFYGVSSTGGYSMEGSLYEYDIVTNSLTTKHFFDAATGDRPHGTLSVYNGKLYGTCSMGSNNGGGNIYEYNPATGIYAQKVILDNVKGYRPYAQLTMYNNKFYGVCFSGGTDLVGTLFEYNPAINSFIKKADFDSTIGGNPFGGLTECNGKLYGTTLWGGSLDSGTLFVFDPITNTLTKKVNMSYSTGTMPYGRMTMLNNKLYGMAFKGGSENSGTLFEYLPAPNGLLVKQHMHTTTGDNPMSNELLAIPALTAPGSPNSCVNSQTIVINAANANEWIQFTDAQGRAVAEINANGNILGVTTVRFYINGGNVRQVGNGAYYLDRNITITPTFQPASPVTVRLYIRKAEFDNLAATAGSGVVVASDLKVYRNTDFCETNLTASTTLLPSTPGMWATDYVYTSNTATLGSFYFAGSPNIPLPVSLITFTGKKAAAVNVLNWKANCSGTVKFEVERSMQALDFVSIGNLQANENDCALPFEFIDANPLAGKNYYRLKMIDEDDKINYSEIVLLDRLSANETTLNIAPNPVIRYELNLQLNLNENTQATFTITDISGKILLQQASSFSKGAHTAQIPLNGLPRGLYLLTFSDGKQQISKRFSIQ